jgi:hypothetical protein
MDPLFRPSTRTDGFVRVDEVFACPTDLVVAKGRRKPRFL